MLPKVTLATLVAVLISGCQPPPGHFMPFAAPVSPDEYGRRLCRHLELEDYSTCLNEVLDYFERPTPNDLPYGRHSTAGPIALVLERRVYLGRYEGSPLVTRFRVTHGDQYCQGGYDAFAGATDAILAVRCSDGRRGRADMAASIDGRNGLGRLELEDGTQADIVFGYKALGQAEPYPYVTWTRPED